MTRLAWFKPEDRKYETGLDRGVLYPKNVPLGDLEAVNLIYNPSAANGNPIPAWGIYGTNVTMTSEIIDGGRAIKVVKNVLTAGSSLGAYAPATVGMTAQTAGTMLTASAEVMNPVGSTLTSIGFILRDNVANDSNVESLISAGAVTHTVPADGVWRRIFVTFVVEPTRTLDRVYIRKLLGPDIPTGETLYFRNVMLNEGGLIDFFDGDTTQTGKVYSWSEAPYDSTSLKYGYDGALAVPWNGLTAIDEKGGEAAVFYYQDGRPFLHVPPPKEFAGQLRAFTYPDAFGEIMGEVEAVDGIFIDSQQPDSFDLSYRTIVASPVGDRYHKIHLVYNVTAVPSARNSATISDSVTPMEFTWDIQAVPIPIAGFRPSAHIIISTQHMSEDNLAELEALLYGDDDAEGSMPDAQTLLDMMNFGNDIIITDHFDGTWSAEGSYKNVYLIGNGIFQIDNVDAVHHGDGTYTINGTVGEEPPPTPTGDTIEEPISDVFGEGSGPPPEPSELIAEPIGDTL